jgi:glycosyltransferase involved in cell wall biosynthesis
VDSARNYDYSIIIPHKNIPDLLQRCLASAPIRQDVQTIIIDDNSDPAVVDFKNFPGLNRPHTEVIFTRAGGGGDWGKYRKKMCEGKLVVFWVRVCFV